MNFYDATKATSSGAAQMSVHIEEGRDGTADPAATDVTGQRGRCGAA
ncbi:hypothetical protein [Micromonospora endolithica]|nr:hypothetical protein [Micromonospora endolithica]